MSSPMTSVLVNAGSPRTRTNIVVNNSRNADLRRLKQLGQLLSKMKTHVSLQRFTFTFSVIEQILLTPLFYRKK